MAKLPTLPKPNKKIVIIAITAVAVLILIQRLTLELDIESTKAFILSFGPLGPIVFIAINVITIIISPLSSFPLWLASLSIYGFIPTFVYIVISHNIGSAANFLIARHLGRPIVKKFAGKQGMKKVDDMANVVGLKVLFVARLIGGTATDYISYAAGLTSIKLKPYILISALVPLPVIFLNIYILHKALHLQPIYFFLFGILGYVLGMAIPYFLYKKAKLRKVK